MHLRLASPKCVFPLYLQYRGRLPWANTRHSTFCDDDHTAWPNACERVGAPQPKPMQDESTFTMPWPATTRAPLPIKRSRRLVPLLSIQSSRMCWSLLISLAPLRRAANHRAIKSSTCAKLPAITSLLMARGTLSSAGMIPPECKRWHRRARPTLACEGSCILKCYCKRKDRKRRRLVVSCRLRMGTRASSRTGLICVNGWQLS